MIDPEYPNAPPWIPLMLEDNALIVAHRRLEFEKMVKRIEDEVRPCEPPKHRWDTDGSRTHCERHL